MWYTFFRRKQKGASALAERRETKRKRASRVVALIVAGIMVFSVLAAAILSQIW